MGVRIVIKNLCVRHNFTINARLAELMPPGWGEDLHAWCYERFACKDDIYYMPNYNTTVMGWKNCALPQLANRWSSPWPPGYQCSNGRSFAGRICVGQAP